MPVTSAEFGKLVAQFREVDEVIRTAGSKMD